VPPQRVTAALIEREGRVLLARRQPGKHMGGRWEFPGGKMKPGETPEECLRRELIEELGIECEVGELLGSTVFHQRGIHLKILLYRARILSGTPKLYEHEELRWVLPEQIGSFELADSDRRLARRLLRRRRQA
jgi:8-oxo-dGTP diphosphatase